MASIVRVYNFANEKSSLMNGSTVAPVLMITYTRLEHLKKAITSLRNNILADQTDLFIASDCHKTDSDVEKVGAVRSYLKGIVGFKSVTIFERERNLGAHENCFTALEVIFRKYDRFILVEDDIVVAPGFLKFMNEAFKIFGQNERVFSITGYCPPIRIPSDYLYDAFFLGRLSAWGSGFTKARFESVKKIPRQEFEEFYSNNEMVSAFLKSSGEDALDMLTKVASGSLEAWDVQGMYTQFKNDQYTIYPAESLVANTGFDGSGKNCGVSDRFNVALSNKTAFNFPKKVFVDQRIVKENLKFRRGAGRKTIFIMNIRRIFRIVKSYARKWLGAVRII